MTGGRTRVVFGETLWRILSGLIPQVKLSLDHSCSSMRPSPIPSENPPFRGSERTTRARSPPKIEGLSHPRCRVLYKAGLHFDGLRVLRPPKETAFPTWG